MQKEPKQVIIIRTDTNPKMRKGKMISQGGHASLATVLDLFCGEYGNRNWIIDDEKRKVTINVKIDMDSPFYIWLSTIFKKIVLGGTLNDLITAYQKAKLEGIPCSLIEDKGLTEFGGVVTITAVAIGPDYPDKIDKITGHLELL
jgi:PTH2 family peptidyl-tRNA hydrolase